MWGQKRLAKMDSNARKEEEYRMMAGKQAAEAAMKSARKAGGDITFSAFCSPSLQPSSNLILFSMDGAELLSFILQVLEKDEASIKTLLSRSKEVGLACMLPPQYAPTYGQLLKETIKGRPYFVPQNRGFHQFLDLLKVIFFTDCAV